MSIHLRLSVKRALMGGWINLCDAKNRNRNIKIFESKKESQTLQIETN